jgi:uncharacterized protein
MSEPDDVGEDWARPVVHWEIVATDAERQAAFYRELCNWEIGEGPIMQIPAGLGGPEPGPGGHIRQGDRPGVTLYVQVRNLDAALARAVALGGRLVAEPFDIPDGPTLAAVDDPEGNPLVLVQQ